MGIAADAGAKAGADTLPIGAAESRLIAQTISQQNSASGSAVLVFPIEDIDLGEWDEDLKTFVVLTGANEDDANAVRVTCRVSVDRGNASQLFFAPVLGIDSAEVYATAIAHIKRSRCSRIFGLDDVKLNDSFTDSYNSDNGSYASQTPGTEGHVCSNGPIDVIGNATVGGDATCGEDDTVNVGPLATVTGSTTPNVKEISLPAIDPGQAATVNDNSDIPPQFIAPNGNLRVNGMNVLTLPGGTYYIDGNMLTSGQGLIEVAGPTVIYVNGTTNLGGLGLANLSEVPANLRIMVMGSTAHFSGNADIHADVYGPTTDMYVDGNGGLYGGVVGKTVTANGNGGIHSDEALSFTDYSNVSVALVQ